MAGINLEDLLSGVYSISKGAVFFSDTAWGFNGDLMNELEFLGFTEGEITLAPNEEYQMLTIDENTGTLPHKVNLQGEAPVLTIPIFTGDPSLRSILSPSNVPSGGFARQLPVATRTVVIFPEELFLSANGQTTLELTYDSGTSAWLLAGNALNAQQDTLLGQALWLWRGHFTKPDVVYRHANAGKSVDETTFVVHYEPAAPNGARAYYIGDPSEINIDVNVGVTS
jgi:hypothetical protein